MTLNVLTLSTLFPDMSRPNFGVFVERQARELASRPDADVTVIAPVGVAGYSALLMAVMCLSSPVFTIAYTACADGARDEGIGEGGAFALMNAIWAAGSACPCCTRICSAS